MTTRANNSHQANRIRIRCTPKYANGGGVAYLYQTTDGRWQCALANGTPAAWSYAGARGDEMAMRFALQDATTPAEALRAVETLASRYLSGPAQGETTFHYELVSPLPPVTPAEQALSRIHALLEGEDGWSVFTLREVASVLREAGLPVREPA